MPQPTVTPTETDTRWSITPTGRAHLDIDQAPTHSFLPEVLHGLTAPDYALAYLEGWHAHAAGVNADPSPHWGGPLEVAYEDGYLDHQRDPHLPWATPLFGFEAACDHTYSPDTYRERAGRRDHTHHVARPGQRYAARVAARVGRAIYESHTPVTEVASAAGLSMPVLTRRLTGRTSFTPTEVYLIAHALGLDPLAFFHDTKEN